MTADIFSRHGRVEEMFLDNYLEIENVKNGI
jgi:hypothetical protein